MLLDEALRFGPGLGGDEGLEGLQEAGPRFFRKRLFHAHLAAAAQQGAVFFQQAHGALIVLGVNQLAQQGVGLVGQQLGVLLDEALRFGPGLGGDEGVQSIYKLLTRCAAK